ncbi:hypothetical protein CALCODRAFT_21434 [Calocera cornea HHB12733]|uniref:Uncharacterized protein n=1 Tax=Calocera cornea HHB12733 TaxID=1353952 RepID=A0A165E690_9BASI|nr:hypothetical protein CALCODRAFT_21434 [Calocera cornea HHB12733]
MRASTAVFITALAASSLAAPVFIDGENKNTVEERGIGKVVGKVAKHLEKQGGHYKSIAKAGAGVYNAVSSRDLEELEGLDERNLFGFAKKLFHHGGKHAANNAANNNGQQQPQQRSLEDDGYELTERDFEELAELDERALDEYLSGLDERGASSMPSGSCSITVGSMQRTTTASSSNSGRWKSSTTSPTSRCAMLTSSTSPCSAGLCPRMSSSGPWTCATWRRRRASSRTAARSATSSRRSARASRRRSPLSCRCAHLAAP